MEGNYARYENNCLLDPGVLQKGASSRVGRAGACDNEAHATLWRAMAENALEPRMNSSSGPQLAVILITPDQGQAFPARSEACRIQTIADRPGTCYCRTLAEALVLNPAEFEPFAALRTISIGEIHSVGAAYAAGIQQPQLRSSPWERTILSRMRTGRSGWCQRTREPWAAVGPQICNANPDSSVATADYLIAYGPWSESAKAGEVEHLPGHNSSYKRELLLEFGDSLGNMLEAESVLHWELRRSGHKLYLETAAKTSHVNFSRLASWASAQYHAGRMFAAFRARNEHWSFLRRSGFTVAGPLIPFVRLQRILRQRHGLPTNTRLFPLLLPTLCFGLVLDGWGRWLATRPEKESPRRKLSISNSIVKGICARVIDAWTPPLTYVYDVAHPSFRSSCPLVTGLRSWRVALRHWGSSNIRLMGLR